MTMFNLLEENTYLLEDFLYDKQFSVESTAVTLWTVGAECLAVLRGQALIGAGPPFLL